MSPRARLFLLIGTVAAIWLVLAHATGVMV